MQAERTWLAEEISRTEAQLNTLSHKEKVRASLITLRERLEEVATRDPRLLLEALGAEVHVRENGEIAVQGSIPADTLIVSNTPDLG